MAIDPADRARLLDLARQSIVAGQGRAACAALPSLQGLPDTLREPRASFVTLRLAGVLRGCRGGLEPVRPLAHDVWEHAWSSAYDDPRFAPLPARDATAVEVSISILSALEPLAAATRAELLRQLEPRRHGVVLACGARRATFLPQVWDTLPEAADFLDRLLAKAGLSDRPWSPLTQAWRYTTESFGPS